MKAFVIDVSKCNGCYNCQIVCKDEHVGNDWTPYARPQPDTGQFWMKLHEHVRGSVPKVKMSYVAVPCMHCQEAPCIPACEPEAIYRREDGLVLIDAEKCTGCMNCLDACPYGVIYFNEDLNLAQKCTGCAHLLDQGWEVPRCVDACPTDALRFGEEEDFQDLIADAEVLHPEYGTQPRVYYLGLPKRFIAGAVYDPEADECLEGVVVKVTNTGTGEVRTVETDIFGDFWFHQVEAGTYQLVIEKDGYLVREIEAVTTEKDVNVGDIPLYKEATVPA
jgi:tetrathionate reductase subunit B